MLSRVFKKRYFLGAYGVSNFTGSIAQMFWLVFSVVILQAIFSIFALNLELAVGASTATFTFSIVTTLLVLAIVWGWHGRLSQAIQGSVRLLAICPRSVWIGGCVVAGTVMGLLWISIFPAPLRSDYATYFSLAKSLSENGTYEISNGGFAYWPPGYPLFLSAHFILFGVDRWVPAFANLLLFGGTIIVAYLLAERILGESAARVSTFLLVLWPANFTSVGLASKERLLVLLLPLIIWLFFVGSERVSEKQRLSLHLLLGITLGFACLTQPSMLLFPAVLLIYELCCGSKSRRRALSFAVIIVGMVLVIAPWTFRNYVRLKAWIPISTNGGDVFYRANNALATGGYTPNGVERLDHLDEVQRGRVGFQLGTEWIRSNPGEFLKLAIRKQTLFLGDDANGVFETLKRALAISDRRYVILKAISNLYWLAIWITILAAVICRIKKGLPKPGTILVLAFFYFFVVHSVFESGGRHHEPLTVCLSLLAAMVVCDNTVVEEGVRGSRNSKTAWEIPVTERMSV